MVQNIVISKKEMELINDLLNLDGDKIYQKYGYKRDETIIKNHPFVDNPEDEIKKMKEQTEANTPFQDKVPLEDVNEDEEEQ